MLPNETPTGVLVNPFGNVSLTKSLGISFTTKPVTCPQSLSIVIALGAFMVPPILPIFSPVGVFIKEFPKFNLDKVLLFLLTTKTYHTPLSKMGYKPTGPFSAPILPRLVAVGIFERLFPKLSLIIVLMS